jgi:hypothetical protein
MPPQVYRGEHGSISMKLFRPGDVPLAGRRRNGAPADVRIYETSPQSGCGG